MIEAAPSTSSSADLIEEFKEDCETRGMSPESTRRYVSSLGIFGQYLANRDQDILLVEKNVIKGFLDYLRKERQVAQKTIENYFSALSSFYDFLEYEGLVTKNPINSVRKRYLRRYKDNDDGQARKLISVEEMVRLEDINVWTMEKTKGGKVYKYWAASWREDGKVRNVYLGSGRNVSRVEALQKANKLKAEGLEIK